MTCAAPYVDASMRCMSFMPNVASGAIMRAAAMKGGKTSFAGALPIRPSLHLQPSSSVNL